MRVIIDSKTKITSSCIDINFKWSFYNITIKTEDGYLIFNTSSMSLVEMDQELYDELREGKTISLNNSTKDIDALISMGILVSSSNEVEKVVAYVHNKWGKLTLPQ